MKYFVICVFLCVFFATGSSIKCFQCSYYEDHVQNNETLAACEDINGLTATDCPKDDDEVKYHCIKRDGKTIDDELKYIERGCSPTANKMSNECKESNALDTPYGMAEKASKCFCNSDGCNSSPKTFIQPTVILISLLSILPVAYAFS